MRVSARLWTLSLIGLCLLIGSALDARGTPPVIATSGVDDRRPYVGIEGRFLQSGEIADLLNMDLTAAILVERVESGSPAARAGLRGGFIEGFVQNESIILGGDIILGVRTPALCWGRCLADLAELLVGLDTVEITILRGGRVRTLTVDLEGSERT